MARKKSALHKAIDEALKAVLPHGSAIIIAVRMSPSDDAYCTEVRGTGDPAVFAAMLDDVAEALLPDLEPDPEPADRPEDEDTA